MHSIFQCYLGPITKKVKILVLGPYIFKNVGQTIIDVFKNQTYVLLLSLNLACAGKRIRAELLRAAWRYDVLRVFELLDEAVDDSESICERGDSLESVFSFEVAREELFEVK